MVEEEAPVAGERQRSIALVDDDRNILTTLSIVLQAEGYAIRVYSDGEVIKSDFRHVPSNVRGASARVGEGLKVGARACWWTFAPQPR